jgi:hypothetical protein
MKFGENTAGYTSFQPRNDLEQFGNVPLLGCNAPLQFGNALLQDGNDSL